mmetsp:Transcript_24975/g.71765  ORF Transcript_24975/g.71765 Transcript_24975/m.71765 type:complete len:90 (-) Transcript_24975:279-548(-)
MCLMLESGMQGCLAREVSQNRRMQLRSVLHVARTNRPRFRPGQGCRLRARWSFRQDSERQYGSSMPLVYPKSFRFEMASCTMWQTSPRE